MNFGLGEILIFVIGMLYGYINSVILRNISLYYIITLGIIVSIVLVISTFIGKKMN
ncbi:MAG: hypothetical protein MPEBLZ_03054 [Candidatus Methanoperedens nitroreducens]|uniref:Uncharacterized protein n=1 Tax=Candidatus Methanoperedens nitratireducens TaxID=1392998 RepID=A0A0N8KQJ8_9EURY|nr:MAG: hypothetical protein MPEBLZ_03054 [Candidatus Methanoperedens sp. BLZ1]CAG0981018.1 hypothetical protein METP2_01973 [Methanosarcinales archaeon]